MLRPGETGGPGTVTQLTPEGSGGGGSGKRPQRALAWSQAPFPNPKQQGVASRGIHRAFPERGSGHSVPREGGAWPHSLAQAGHALRELRPGQGQLPNWGSGAQEAPTPPPLWLACVAVAHTFSLLPDTRSSVLRPFPGRRAQGRSQRPEFPPGPARAVLPRGAPVCSGPGCKGCPGKTRTMAATSGTPRSPPTPAALPPGSLNLAWPVRSPQLCPNPAKGS